MKLRLALLAVPMPLLCGATTPLRAEAVASGDDRQLSEVLAKYKTLEKRMDGAKRLFQARDLQKAVGEFQKCLDLLADHHEAHYFLGQIRYHQGEIPEALKHAQSAIRSLDHLDRSYAAAEAERRAFAERRIDVLQYTVDQYGKEEPGGCMADTVADAKTSIRELKSESKSAGAGKALFAVPAGYHFLEANSLFRLGRLDEAIAQQQQALKRDPQHAGAWNNLIHFRFLKGDVEGAREAIRQAEGRAMAIQPNVRKEVLGKD